MVLSVAKIQDKLSDEVTIPSLPSDEWGKRPERSTSSRLSNDHDTAGKSKSRLLMNKYNAEDVSVEERESTRRSLMQKSFTSNSFGGYLSHLVPGNVKSSTTATDTRTDTHTETRICERSSHSRCYIENTESIQERRDDDGDACRRQNQNTEDTMSSVEEISQISDITMDIKTIGAESKFSPCTPLPTISEARKYDPAGCVSPMLLRRGSGCASGEAKNDKNDMIDFVFELFEDALCTPLNGSKADKKKAFAKAVQEESIKLSRKNSLADAFQMSSSKHSRSIHTQRRSGKGQIVEAASNGTLSPASSTKPAVNGVTIPSQHPPTVPSLTRDEPSFVFVGKPPSPTPPSERNMFSAQADEEQTLDWSKIMSFAERQLEGEDKSVISNSESRISRFSRSNRRSFFHDSSTVGDIKYNSTLNTFASAKSNLDFASPDARSVSGTNKLDHDPQQDKSTSSTASNSSSTHATAAGATSSAEGSTAVQELRELSAMPMDSFSFEDEPRLLLTSLVLRLVRQLIAFFKSDVKMDQPIAKSSRDVSDKPSHPTFEDYSDENYILKALRYAAFVLAFIFWPSGIPRRKIEYQPLPKKPEKPSLLKLVFEAPDEVQ